MANDEAFIVLDNYGDEIRIEPDGGNSGNLIITFSVSADDSRWVQMALDAERRGQFRQAYAAAERQAEAHGGH